MTTHINQSIHIQLNDETDQHDLFGNHDEHMHLLEESYNIDINYRGQVIHLSGVTEAIEQVESIINLLEKMILKGYSVTLSEVTTAINLSKKNQLDTFFSLYETVLYKDGKGKMIRAKTASQQRYVQSIRSNAVVFGIGPAGTGKTFLAVAMAVQALKKGEVERIIITRPAVEAGENLGFLPGDLQEKVNPYLRPIFDALHQLIGVEHMERLMDRGVIEIAPLAYMRGRTLENAFIILDEAQNTTQSQMKMFLTRLGMHSKMVINGDKTQIDLPKGVKSGLIQAEQLLKNIKKIGFTIFSAEEVVRHPVVTEIITAYQNEA